MDLVNLKTRLSKRALTDLISSLQENEWAIASSVAVERMKSLKHGPWRVVGGGGLTDDLLAQLLSPFGIAPRAL